MPRTITVAAIQNGPCGMDRAANLKRADVLLERALAHQPQIVCFPELFQTYFFAVNYYADYRHFFEPIPGPTTAHLARQALAHGINVIAGLAEITPAGERYNSAVIIDARGEIVGKYRKAQVPLNVSDKDYRRTYEKNYFREGDLGFPVFDVAGARVGILICYDRHFPEAFRALALQGAEIIFVPTGARTWRKGWRSGMWEMMLRVRAYENCSYVVGVNRVGQEDQTTFFGRSVIVSPLGGEIVAASEVDGEDVVAAPLDLDLVAQAHEELPVVRDRRPEFYGLLAGPGPPRA